VDAAASPWLATFLVKQLQGGGSGNFTVRVQPQWAPVGARRFRRLLEDNVFISARFFRVIKGFAAQFGIPGDPLVAATWRRKVLPDDTVRVTNKRGRLSYAAAGPDSRTTQIFINLGGNRYLDKAGFAPFAEVIEGMDVIDALYGGYGEGPPDGRGPDQRRIQTNGNGYLEANFPLLSYVEATWHMGDTARPAQEEEEDSEWWSHAVPVVVGLVVLGIAIVLFARVGCKLRSAFDETEKAKPSVRELESLKSARPRPQVIPGGDGAQD